MCVHMHYHVVPSPVCSRHVRCLPCARGLRMWATVCVASRHTVTWSSQLPHLTPRHPAPTVCLSASHMPLCCSCNVLVPQCTHTVGLEGENRGWLRGWRWLLRLAALMRRGALVPHPPPRTACHCTATDTARVHTTCVARVSGCRSVCGAVAAACHMRHPCTLCCATASPHPFAACCLLLPPIRCEPASFRVVGTLRIS